MGCLPTDTRPPPASVFVQASPNDALRNGFTTDDGWYIEFSRFLMSLGYSALLESGSCTPYSDAHYSRILDLQQSAPQKVSLIYGLGQCGFSFGVVHPNADSIVGIGVTQQEAQMMQTAGSDRYTAPSGQLTGINTYVVGVATRGSERKTFAWSFRQDYAYQTCLSLTDAGVSQGLNLRSNDSDLVDLLVRGETLFQTDVDATRAKLHFEPMAEADTLLGNNDGDVTLDELGLVRISEQVSPTGVVSDGGPNVLLAVLDAGDISTSLLPGDALDASVNDYVAADGGVTTVSTLEDFVYQILFSTSVHYQDTGRCASVVARVGRGS